MRKKEEWAKKRKKEMDKAAKGFEKFLLRLMNGALVLEEYGKK